MTAKHGQNHSTIIFPSPCRRIMYLEKVADIQREMNAPSPFLRNLHQHHIPHFSVLSHLFHPTQEMGILFIFSVFLVTAKTELIRFLNSKDHL